MPRRILDGFLDFDFIRGDRRNDTEILAEDSAKAHQTLKDWTARTRAMKEQRLDKDMLDQRGIDMSKVDISGLKKA